MQHKHSPFENINAISSYIQNAYTKVPGLADFHRMMLLLLAEHTSDVANILIVGAGGGMETKALAEAQPAWRFTGVDPSSAMINLARQTLVPFMERVDLLEGTVEQAPIGPFDGATCILTLHHIDRNERLHTLREIHRRLKPGARIVIMGHSAPGANPESWMRRSVAFGDRDGPNWTKAADTGRMMTARLPLLTPSEEEEQLREAGFVDVEMFYAAFSFRGWVGSAVSL